MGDLLEKFRAAMGFALLEYRGDGEFFPVAPLPPWFPQVWGAETGLTAPLALLEKSPFLENFLYEAEAFWESPAERACQSETWVEKSPDGHEIALQARALLLEGRRALLIFNPDAEFREQVKTLQTARNALLDHERLAHEIQKKEILLHCIVHDLSQPLSVMHVAMECLATDAISERSKQFLTLGKLASDQQETMIRDILHTFSSDLRASLDAGTEESAAADLLGCARQSMTALGPTFEAKGVSLALAPALDAASSWPVRAEDSRLRRIFSNLLENALRYTPARGRVTVGMEDEGGFLKAYVDDEGPGLPSDLRPEQIFGLFLKGKQSGGKAGLGLYFCRITVERWGGNIGCVSLPIKGSRFWFRLPHALVATTSTISGPTGSPEAREPRHLPPQRPLRILFADDQKDIRTLTTYQLKRSGHKVVSAKNGKEALQRFRSGKFDAVLLDQEMPGMTGDEVARAIRKAENGKKSRTYLVASTGNNGAEDIRRLKAAGFDSVLGKPFRLEDLHALLQSAGADKGTAREASKPAARQKMDFARLLASVDGDEKLLKRMISTFLRDTPKRLAELATALRKKSAADVATLAHALKGSISIFGAEAARNYSQELQEHARDGDLATARQLLAPLNEEIANLLENLRGYAQQSSAGSAPNSNKRPGPSRIRSKRRR
jgi:signal transduction histidine kinase/CheY-like chemotaxis protein/HPt (histidine-containing phosphotransfer) domain-containing protein